MLSIIDVITIINAKTWINIVLVLKGQKSKAITIEKAYTQCFKEIQLTNQHGMLSATDVIESYKLKIKTVKNN